MKSSSSRNLAHQYYHHGPTQAEQQQAYRSQHLTQDKFIVLQILQAILFTTRISFLLYDLVHAIVHKMILYDRVGRMFGGSPTSSEKLYTISIMLIAVLLLAMIVFTFVYNYMLVHENLKGMMAMGVFLLLILLYNLITFGQYSMMESAIVCGASAGEIIGLLYLLTLIKHKKQVRHVQQFEKRFSTSENKQTQQPQRNQSPLANRQMPHQLKPGGGGGLTSPTPPSITISFTESDTDNIHKPEHPKPEAPIEEEEEVEEEGEKIADPYGSDQSLNSQQSNHEQKSHKQPPIDSESSTEGQIQETRRRRHHRPHHGSSSHLTVPKIEQPEEDKESEEPQQRSNHHHHQHHRKSHHRKRDQTDVKSRPEVYNNSSNESERSEADSYRQPAPMPAVRVSHHQDTGYFESRHQTNPYYGEAFYANESGYYR